MSTAVTKAPGAKFDPLPTKVELIGDGKGSIGAAQAVGGVALGLIASHAALNIIKKQDSLIANGSLLVGGFYGACKVKHPLLKMLCAGAAAYGAIKMINKATAVVAVPGATEGLAGMLPESVKEALRKFIPTFAGIDEVSGLGNATGDVNDEFGDLSLEDQGNYSTDGLGNDEEGTSGIEEMSGLAA